MRSYLLPLLSILAILTMLSTYSVWDNTQQLSQFELWKLKYNKDYDPYTHIYRYYVYQHTRTIVYEHNLKQLAGLVSYQMGINQFADLTHQQFVAQYLSVSHMGTNHAQNANTTYTCTGAQPPEKTVPDSWDWAAKSAVSAIKDIGTCAASYAAASIQSIQSSRYQTIGKVIPLSPQQVVDCGAQFGNQGCIKGNATSVFGYIYRHGAASETKYPWRGFSYTCYYSAALKQAQMLGCVKINSNKQSAVKNAVFKQPLVVSINAEKIKNYKSGVYQSEWFLPCKKNPNHWMLLVGYGRDEQKKINYWKLKNSWGVNWGMQGYLYIVRKGDGEGQCGVQQQLYYPIA